MLKFVDAESGFVIRQLNAADEDEAAQFQRLRKQYWVDKYGWADEAQPGRETDYYDKLADHFGLFNYRGDLVGYIRFINGTIDETLHSFDKFGAKIHQPERLRYVPAFSGEVSRLLVVENMRDSEAFHAAQWLYKIVYQACKRSDKSRWYIEAESWLIKVLNDLHFPFRKISRGDVDAKGITTYVAVMELAEAEWELSKNDMERFSWYTEGLPMETLNIYTGEERDNVVPIAVSR